MKNVFVWLLAGVGVAGGVSGCTTDATDPYPSADSYCAARAEAECSQDNASACGATVEACKTKRKSACNTAASAATSGGRTYASGQVQGCVDKTKEIYAKKTITPTDLKAQADVCERVFAGSAAKGAACTTDYSCSSSLVCDTRVKVCGEKVVKKLGDGCANPGESCDTGSFCGGGEVKLCVARKNKGEACNDATAPCLETLRCGGGTCVDRLNAGDTCTSDNDCSATAPLCDGAAKKCVAGLQFAIGTSTCKEFGAN